MQHIHNLILSRIQNIAFNIQRPSIEHITIKKKKSKKLPLLELRILESNCYNMST